MPADFKPHMSRQERARQAVRQRIMDEGRILFAEKGYTATTMRDVAKSSEYAASALYYHFKDKAELMNAICAEDFRGLSVSLQASITSADPVENLKNLGRTYAQFALDFPNHYRLMFIGHHGPDVSDKDLAGKGNPSMDAYAGLLHLVTLAMEQGLFRSGLTDAHLVAQTFWSGLHGMITLHLDQACEHWVPWVDIHARIEMMCDVLSRGMIRAQGRIPV